MTAQRDSGTHSAVMRLRGSVTGLARVTYPRAEASSGRRSMRDPMDEQPDAERARTIAPKETADRLTVHPEEDDRADDGGEGEAAQPLMPVQARGRLDAGRVVGEVSGIARAEVVAAI